MPVAPVKVTVLTTLYNKGAYVEEAVRSVLAQTFQDFELLVVDDASTDDGLEKVKAMTDPRIRILESTVNTGRAAAANRGYDAARGTYVAVLDADDLMVPERLAKQVSYMDAHPEVGACGTEFQELGGPVKKPVRPASDRECRAMMLFGDPVHYQTSMLRRSVLEQHHLRCNPEWKLPGMDYLFILSIAAHAAYANLREPLLIYRMGANNMRHGRDAVADMHHLYRAVFDLFGIPATDKQIILHTFFHPDLGGAPPNAVQVSGLGRWKKKLIKINRMHGYFPAQEFEAQLERRWEGLFHPIVQENASGALLHMWLTGKVKERAGYWAKVTAERWFKRSHA